MRLVVEENEIRSPDLAPALRYGAGGDWTLLLQKHLPAGRPNIAPVAAPEEDLIEVAHILGTTVTTSRDI